MSFSSLHDWINLYSESGMGDTVKGAGSGEETHAEEAEYEKVRELHTKSQGELCFKQKNVCAIYLQDGGPLADKDADAILSFEGKFASKSDRGIKYNWMWMDVSQEPQFKVGTGCGGGPHMEQEAQFRKDIEKNHHFED